MSNAIYHVPIAVNEPILSYKTGSPERAALKIALEKAKSKPIDVPMHIGGRHIATNKKGIIKRHQKW